MADKNGLDVLTADEAASEAGVSVRLILNSLRSDDENSLRGRNLAGRKGWVTTRRELAEWVERGNENPDEETAAVG